MVQSLTEEISVVGQCHLWGLSELRLIYLILPPIKGWLCFFLSIVRKLGPKHDQDQEWKT